MASNETLGSDIKYDITEKNTAYMEIFQVLDDYIDLCIFAYNSIESYMELLSIFSPFTIFQA
jgi:hypothetical protein